MLPIFLLFFNLCGVAIKEMLCDNFVLSNLHSFLGEHIGESKEYALENFPKLKYINGYNDAEICAGAGSMGVEILGKVYGRFVTTQ